MNVEFICRRPGRRMPALDKDEVLLKCINDRVFTTETRSVEAAADRLSTTK